jgi:hypothetical protein
MAFLLNLVGFIVFIAGAAWLATLCGVSQAYILASAAVMFCVAIVISIANSRVHDPA